MLFKKWAATAEKPRPLALKNAILASNPFSL
jgi:hypothetical protein